ncbi:hypothetical protein [Streptomyces sp. NPDC090445]|uniref:hypothetical protein n=1 Tax=Streptomyces sp. NPDC090445 TaxID=3365963 RepID=UPI0038230C5A
MFPFTLRAIRSWAAVLACAAVAWGGTAAPAAPATTVLPAQGTERIELDPMTGPPGSPVGVHGYGFENCRKPVQGAVGDVTKTPSPEPTSYRPGVVAVSIAPGGGAPDIAVVDLDTGEFKADVTAPSDAAPGRPLTVLAKCASDLKIRATAQFNVEPTPVPALSLDRTTGPVRTPVQVTGSGFDYCAAKGSGKARLTWDGRPLDGVEPAAVDPESGSFSAGIEVPADAVPGDNHKVTATCVGYESVYAETPFTVEKSPEPSVEPSESHEPTDEPTETPEPTVEPSETPEPTDEPTDEPTETPEPTVVPPGTPDVVLTPTEGPAGADRVAVTGSGFNCPFVNVLWDRESVGPVKARGNGTFTVGLDIAPNVRAGDHAVRAECQSDPAVADEATFRVTDTPLPPPTSESAPTPDITADETDGPTDGPTGGTTDGPTDGPTPARTSPDGPTPARTSPDGLGPADGGVPVGLVVGTSLVGVALIAAFGASRLVHRSPRWVQKHVSARLRPAPAATSVAEHAAEEDGAGSHTIRLEPHADPGEQTVQENTAQEKEDDT